MSGIRKGYCHARSLASWCVRRSKITARHHQGRLGDAGSGGRGARRQAVITLVDRLEGATENLGKEGIALVAFFTTRELLG